MNFQKGAILAFEIGYEHWKKKFASVLETFSDKNIFVLYSGGKDSSAILYLFDQARREYEFTFQVHTGVFPHHRYPQSEIDRLSSYWRARDIRINWHQVAAPDAVLADGNDPCRKCQEIRKKLLQGYLSKTISNWQDVVLVISYSLWDLASYAIENVLHSQFTVPSETQGGDQRFIETAQRFYSLLEMKDGYRIFRPLILYNDQDIKSLINDQSIPTLTIPCAHKDHRPKRILGQYYDAQGLRFDYSKVLAFARSALKLPDQSVFKNMSKDEYLGKLF
jgi:tRNA(Ile)-lysidine synthase TilS/MesJ